MQFTGQRDDFVEPFVCVAQGVGFGRNVAVVPAVEGGTEFADKLKGGVHGVIGALHRVTGLFPWAVVFKELGLLALIEMGIFLIILITGLAYVWVKADLDWVKRRVNYGTGRYKDMHMKEAN